MRYLSAYENTSAHFALPQLVALLDRASKHVQKRFPGSVMGIGHLSNKNGGDIDRHASHETGRDADVAFYAKDAKGKPVLLPSLTRYDRLGRAEGHPGVTFDDARNWELMVALVNDPEVRVGSLFVAPFIRVRLLGARRQAGHRRRHHDSAFAPCSSSPRARSCTTTTCTCASAARPA